MLWSILVEICFQFVVCVQTFFFVQVVKIKVVAPITEITAECVIHFAKKIKF